MLDGSVILVHGLGGDSRTTWEAKGPNNKTVNWVTDKDFLPAELPNARIFTYGYNANIWKDRVTSRVEDHADGLRGGLLTYRRKCKDRPILWIGHSLGGTIIKRTLITHNEEYCTYIRNASTAIIFLGTPHHGSDEVNNPWLLITRKLVACASLRHNVGPLLKELKPFSDTLRDTTKSFSEISAPFLIRSFYETKSTRLPPPEGDQLIVQEGSAVMGLPNEKLMPLSTTHKGLCKFATTADPNYFILCQQIVDLATVSIEKISERLKCDVQLSERFQNLSVPRGTLPHSHLDINNNSAHRGQSSLTRQTTPRRSSHLRLKGMENIDPEVVRKKTEEALAPVLELLTNLGNRQCSQICTNCQHKQHPHDLHETLQGLRGSLTNTSRENTQASLRSSIGIGSKLIDLVDAIKASLNSGTPSCKRLVQTCSHRLSLLSQGIQLGLRILMQLMPAMLPYTPIGRCIRFEDFYGRTRSFDTTYFPHFQVFDIFIRYEYRGGPGGYKVDKNEYRIGGATDPSFTITADTWSAMTLAGSHLIMSATVKPSETRQCPTCQFTFLDEGRSSHYCEGCSQSCYFHDESPLEAQSSGDFAEACVIEPLRGDVGLHAPVEITAESELGIFRNLWVPYARSGKVYSMVLVDKHKTMVDLPLDGITVDSPPDDVTNNSRSDSGKLESENNIYEAEPYGSQAGRQEVESHFGVATELSKEPKLDSSFFDEMSNAQKIDLAMELHRKWSLDAWSCCQCGNSNLVANSSDCCPTCGHFKCPSCAPGRPSL